MDSAVPTFSPLLASQPSSFSANSAGEANAIRHPLCQRAPQGKTSMEIAGDDRCLLDGDKIKTCHLIIVSEIHHIKCGGRRMRSSAGQVAKHDRRFAKTPVLLRFGD